MTVNEKMLQGNAAYMNAIARYGHERIIDQIQNHCFISEKCWIGTYLILTDEFVICTGHFIVAYPDIEVFYLPDAGAGQNLTVYDRMGGLHKFGTSLPAGVIPSIRAAVMQRAPSARFDLSIQTQLDYKRRHQIDLERNARELMRRVPRRTYTRKDLYYDTYTYMIVFIAIIAFLGVITFSPKGGVTVTSVIALLIMIGCMVAVIIFLSRLKQQANAAYKNFVKAHEGEVLDQLNNRLVYVFSGGAKGAVYVTQKYLIVKGGVIIPREDVVCYHGYIHKGYYGSNVYDRFGRQYFGRMAMYNKADLYHEEQVITSLLPNAVAGRSEENMAYVRSFNTGEDA